MSGFHDIVMFGQYYSQDEADVASGQTASVCCAVQSEDESGGYGTPRTMSGPRCTQSNRRDGYMSMRARKLGISLGCIPRVSSPSFH